MYWWKHENRILNIYWFNKSTYELNCSRTPQQSHWNYTSFTTYVFEDWTSVVRCGYAVEESFDTTSYSKHFINKIPENPVFYFDASSKYPRTKIQICNYKRCIKPSKANVIVIENPVKWVLVEQPFTLLTDDNFVYAIPSEEFYLKFKGDPTAVVIDKNIGYKFNGELHIIYSGKIKLLDDPSNIVTQFNNGSYKGPFITDADLDKTINTSLPDPNLEELKTIKEMLDSSDKNIIKLGAMMAAGYNITKWPLVFRVMLCSRGAWVRPENGGSAVIIEQMRSTLKIPKRFYHSGLRDAIWVIQGLKEKYSQEDIAITKEFVRQLPELERFCQRNKSFVKDIEFIPDEYKK